MFHVHTRRVGYVDDGSPGPTLAGWGVRGLAEWPVPTSSRVVYTVERRHTASPRGAPRYLETSRDRARGR